MDGMGRYTGGEGKELSGIGVNEARQAGHLALSIWLVLLTLLTLNHSI